MGTAGWPPTGHREPRGTHLGQALPRAPQTVPASGSPRGPPPAGLPLGTGGFPLTSCAHAGWPGGVAQGGVSMSLSAPREPRRPPPIPRPRSAGSAEAHGPGTGPRPLPEPDPHSPLLHSPPFTRPRPRAPRFLRPLTLPPRSPRPPALLCAAQARARPASPRQTAGRLDADFGRFLTLHNATHEPSFLNNHTRVTATTVSGLLPATTAQKGPTPTAEPSARPAGKSKET